MGLRTLARLGARLTEEDGATAVEYALMTTLVAVVIVVAVTAFGLGVLSLFTSIPTTF